MRKNIRDNFEDLYLRSNIVKRDISNADPKVLKSKEFNKICVYMANTCFSENRKFLLTCGFDFDDILSISKIFGATYVGAKFDLTGSTEKGKNLVMMRYIGQRLSLFVKWTSKKLHDEEISSEVFEKCMAQSGTSSYISPEEEIEMMEEIMFGVKKKARWRMENSIKDKRKQHREEKLAQETLFASLRAKLDNNHESLTEVLVYYSNAKAVSHDVRKAAQKYCVKYGIDFQKEELKV